MSVPLTRVGKLLRIAAERNRTQDFVEIRFRAERTLRESLYLRCREDGIAVPAALEALIRGFVTKHPAALAMIDQWIRDEGLEKKPPAGPVIKDRELAELYAAIARGHEEDTTCP